jgi:predicted HTH domain antitoxin
MDTLTVKIKLPRDLLGALDIPEARLESRLKELIAVELFREERISSGKGAEMLGISKGEFIQLLAQYGVCYFAESPEELATGVATVERLLGERGA